MRGHHGLLPAAPLGTGPGTKVAVMGLGGLGHLAVKFARAMGADVTVLSQSLKSTTTPCAWAPATATPPATRKPSAS